MKKSLKILCSVIVLFIICLCTMFLIDYNRCSNLKMPIFTITNNTNDNGTDTYYGIFYRVELEKGHSDGIIKTEMYIFNKFITGAVSDTTDFGKSEDEEDLNSKIEKYHTFRAVVLKSDLEVMEVEPIKEKDKKVLSDKVSIHMGKNNDMLYTEGQELLITYTGSVIETYPTQIEVINVQTETEYKTKIEDLPFNYSLAQAIKDNCVICTNNLKIYNEDELYRFLKNVSNNTPDFIRCIAFTDEGDMLITDVNFEGSNSFRICEDFTRDEFSSNEDRTYKYGRLSKLVVTEENGIYLESPLEGDIEFAFISGYGNKYEYVNGYDTNYFLEINENDKNESKKVVIDKKIDYDIFYYGIDSVLINVDGENIDLIEALLNDRVTIDKIIEKAEADSVNGVSSKFYKNENSTMYLYGSYTILKNNKYIYIGRPDINLN